MWIILTNQQAAWWFNAFQLPREKMLYIWNPSSVSTYGSLTSYIILGAWFPIGSTSSVGHYKYILYKSNKNSWKGWCKLTGDKARIDCSYTNGEDGWRQWDLRVNDSSHNPYSYIVTINSYILQHLLNIRQGQCRTGCMCILATLCKCNDGTCDLTTGPYLSSQIWSASLHEQCSH